MNLNFLNRNKVIKPSTKIYRKQIVEGVSIPAIIHNMNYFFVDLGVYEDGRVDCWDFQDLEHFKHKVNSGWVVLAIPDNESLSIHGLGDWVIAEGRWNFTAKTFIDYVLSLIKDMNPQFNNIYRYVEKKVGNVIIGENGTGIIYKNDGNVKDDPFSKKVNADSVNLFYKLGMEYWLVKVVVFADGTVSLSRLEDPIEIELNAFEKLIEDEVILSDIPDGARVNIYGLGSFRTKESGYSTKIDQKLLEIKDMLRSLKGQPSAIDICREAYELYLRTPTVAQKEVLRVSYENVPDHQKSYVGDMDTKDIAVRMILYGEDQIEDWSHYQLAKLRGDELPIISIPLPNDKTDNDE